jgi:hypothetical protein
VGWVGWGEDGMGDGSRSGGVCTPPISLGGFPGARWLGIGGRLGLLLSARMLAGHGFVVLLFVLVFCVLFCFGFCVICLCCIVFLFVVVVVVLFFSKTT